MAIYVDVLQGGTNSHGVTVDDFNAFATDFLSDGVVGAITNTSGVAPSTGAFACNAQGTPDMTVAVTQGKAYVTGTPTSGTSQRVRVNMDASANVTIAANSSGSTKYDWVYIKLDPDKMKDPSATANDVATLVTSRSTSSSTDDGTPPTYGYNIAVVTVANGASSIGNASIADKRAETSAKGVAERFATNAITLGYTEITTDFTTTTTPADADVTNLAVTVTVPSGGRRMKITVYSQYMAVSGVAGTNADLKIKEGSTVLHSSRITSPASSYALPATVIYSAIPTAGVHTYKVSVAQNNAGTFTLKAAATYPAFILVELA